MVAPPITNQLEYKVSARADGGNVRGKTMRGAGRPAVRKTARLDDQYGQSDNGTVLKTLQFQQLVSYSGFRFISLTSNRGHSKMLTMRLSVQSSVRFVLPSELECWFPPGTGAADLSIAALQYQLSTRRRRR